MANVANINFRADAALKEEFAEVVEDMGLTVTTAFTAFMKATVREGKLPFHLRSSRRRLTDDERETLELVRDPDTKWFNSVEEMVEADGWYK